jgi:hypothetical protein
MQEVVLSARSPIRRPSLRLGYRLIALLLVCFGLAPMAQAVGPDTDGAIPGSNNGEGVPTATPIDGSGIASRYPGDKNIASDPAVIFADDFESYTSPNQLTTRWDGAGPLANLRIATEAGNFFAGGKSLEMTLPISATETVNDAHKVLGVEQDVIYFRAYTKFDPGYSVSTSNHNGLRVSAHYPGGAGVIPPADGTGFFLFSVQNNIQGSGRPGETDPGYSHVYAYWPHQRSEFGDHWFPDGWVSPGGWGDWILYPFQYPGFVAMPNWLPQRGKWYCYEIMVKANTIGKNDGEVAYWIDGKLTSRFTNLFLRSISSLKIDYTALRLHALHSERVNKKWYDNVVIATKYIGPMVSATTARGDFNGDGFTDYLLFNPSTRRTAIWNLRGNAFLGGVYGPTLPAGWKVVYVADVNLDRKPDYVLFNASTRQTAVWFLNNAAFMSGSYGPTLPVGWTLVAAADMNNDGRPDYVLFNPGTRQTAIWFLNGTMFTGGAFGPTLPSGWMLKDALDFDANNKPDYLLSNPTTRRSAIWYLNGTTFAGGAYGPILLSGWTLQGAADFNTDAKPDYVLFQASTRRTAVWYLNGGTLTGGAYGPTLAAGYSLAFP